MKIAIIGYGEQGRCAYEYWRGPENQITICDQNDLSQQVPAEVDTQLGSNYLNDLHKFDLIVRSPGVHPNEIVDNNKEDPDILNKVTTVTNEFFRVCPAPIIAVTGTKGKGTTSALISNILQASGHRPILGGNIGTPPLDLLRNNIQQSDVVVLELANFQLIDLRYSPKIAVCLMVAPEHLDWHKDMHEYITAKQQLFKHQQPDNLAVYNALNNYSEEVASVSNAHKEVYEVPPEGENPIDARGAYVDGDLIKMEGQTICHVHDVALLGRHNLENVCAAIAATWAITGANQKAIKQTVKNFAGLPHRLEIVKQIKHVWYINDSFGTTPETAIVAIKAFKQPKVLILGGSDKGSSYQELAREVVKSDIRHIIAIGQTGPKILQYIKSMSSADKQIPATIIDENSNMSNIVATAAKYAKKGDVVLLSTACASFGMFANYKDRGEQFNQAVQALAQAGK